MPALHGDWAHGGQLQERRRALPDVPHGHAGACHVRLLRSPGVLLPQGRHSEADLPRPFATIHLQYIATHYCATADKTYMQWFRTVDMQMENGEKVEIARDRTAADTDVAMRKVMDSRLTAARELEMKKTATAAPRLRDEARQL